MKNEFKNKSIKWVLVAKFDKKKLSQARFYL